MITFSTLKIHSIPSFYAFLLPEVYALLILTEYIFVEHSYKYTLIYLGMKLLGHKEGSASKDNFIRLSIVF